MLCVSVTVVVVELVHGKDVETVVTLKEETVVTVHVVLGLEVSIARTSSNSDSPSKDQL